MNPNEIINGIKLMSRLLKNDMPESIRKAAAEKILNLIELL